MNYFKNFTNFDIRKEEDLIQLQDDFGETLYQYRRVQVERAGFKNELGDYAYLSSFNGLVSPKRKDRVTSEVGTATKKEYILLTTYLNVQVGDRLSWRGIDLQVSSVMKQGLNSLEVNLEKIQ